MKQAERDTRSLICLTKRWHVRSVISCLKTTSIQRQPRSSSSLVSDRLVIIRMHPQLMATALADDEDASAEVDDDGDSVVGGSVVLWNGPKWRCLLGSPGQQPDCKLHIYRSDDSLVIRDDNMSSHTCTCGGGGGVVVAMVLIGRKSKKVF